MNKRLETILAIDPGIRTLGFVVLREKELLTSGVRSLPRESMATAEREAVRLVKSWIAAYHPTALVLERTYRHPVASFHALHRLAMRVRRFAASRGIATIHYAPQTVRKGLLGNGHASKRELAAAVATRFPALRVYLTQDRKWKVRYFYNMFDAVSLALYHQGQRRRPPSRGHTCGFLGASRP